MTTIDRLALQQQQQQPQSRSTMAARQVRPHRGFSSCALDDSSPTSHTSATGLASPQAPSISTPQPPPPPSAAASPTAQSQLHLSTMSRVAATTSGPGSLIIGTPRRFFSRRRAGKKLALQQPPSAAAAPLSCRCPFTFVLPDLSRQPDGFRRFIEADLLDPNALANLEAAGCLNWWHRNGLASRLWPLATSGDGNCLLHAISLCMFGAHDRQLILRAALHRYLRRRSAALYRRWRWQTHAELTRTTGLRLSDSEWRAEWKSLLQLARAAPKSIPAAPGDRHTYSSLEEIHVFVAANVIRRPIIVVADAFVKAADGGNLAPNPFAGLYLPLLERPETCCPYPVLLAFHSAHFSALLPMEATPGAGYLTSAIPLVSPSGSSLAVHFAHDPGSGFKWSRGVADAASAAVDATVDSAADLLADYLHCCQLPARAASDTGVSGVTRLAPGRDQPPAHAMATFAGTSGDSNGGGCSNGAANGSESGGGGGRKVETISRSFGRQVRHALQLRRGQSFNSSGAVNQQHLQHSHSLSQQQQQQQPKVSEEDKNDACAEALLNSSPRRSDIAAGTSGELILCARIGLVARPPNFTEVVTGYLVRARARYEQQQQQQQQQQQGEQPNLAADSQDQTLAPIEAADGEQSAL